MNDVLAVEKSQTPWRFAPPQSNVKNPEAQRQNKAARLQTCLFCVPNWDESRNILGFILVGYGWSP
jgi:hypothetical protein